MSEILALLKAPSHERANGVSALPTETVAQVTVEGYCPNVRLRLLTKDSLHYQEEHLRALLPYGVHRRSKKRRRWLLFLVTHRRQRSQMLTQHPLTIRPGELTFRGVLRTGDLDCRRIGQLFDLRSSEGIATGAVSTPEDAPALLRR